MELRQTVNPTLTEIFVQKILAAFKAAPLAKLVDTPLVKLWQSQAFAPTPQSVVADFNAVVCDFTDYAPAALTLGDIMDPSANSQGFATAVSWTISDPGVITQNTVYGYWVEDVNNDVLMFERFPEGTEVEMTEDGSFLGLLVVMPLPLATDGLVDVP